MVAAVPARRRRRRVGARVVPAGAAAPRQAGRAPRPPAAATRRSTPRRRPDSPTPASIPVIGAGLWLAHAASTTPAATCQSALQGPLLAVGFVAFLVSLPGFIGARYHVSWALWLYLAALILLILALLGATVFGLVVTAGGGGAQVPGRPYREYRPRDYSSWLQKHVADERYWRPVLACVASSRACREVAGWTPEDYMRRDLTPVQSGCCKPPTSCVYGDGELAVTAVQEEDCYVWRNDPAVLCYGCESCRAGVMEQLRRHCHNLTILNVALLLVLIAVCSGRCCAYRNARRAEYAYGGSKIHPRWDYFWSRCWRAPSGGGGRRPRGTAGLPRSGGASGNDSDSHSPATAAGGHGGDHGGVREEHCTAATTMAAVGRSIARRQRPWRRSGIDH